MNIAITLRQFFSMFTVLFAAGEKLAMTADNLATVAQETSGAYVDSARSERARKAIILDRQLAST